MLANSVKVEFRRWTEKRPNGEKLHNRYLLTNLGGVSFGIGTDAGVASQHDDLSLLSREQYVSRWNQYVNGSGFTLVDQPHAILGSRK